MTTPQFRDEYDVGFDAGRKSVHDACVDAWKADYYKAAFAAGAASRDAEVEALKRELREGDDLRERLSDILTRSVNAIRGEPEPLSLHSWHDLPELIEALRAEYNDLIYCVVKKYPGESRHDTAKRYLIDREKFSIGKSKAAIAAEGGKT